MIEIFLLAVGLFAAFCIGLVAGAGVVAQRIRRIAVEIRSQAAALAAAEGDAPITYHAGFVAGAKIALGELLTRLDAPRR